MRSALLWILVVAVVGGGAYGMVAFQEQAEQAAYQADLARLKRDFLSAQGSLLTLDPAAYRQEIGPQLAAYFRGLDDLKKKYPAQYDIERESRASADKVIKGELSEAQKTQHDERFALTKELFEKMQSGQYRPLYTAVDHNFRFDVIDMAAASAGGEQKVKLSFVHWGPFPADYKPSASPLSYKSINGNLKADQVEGKPVEIPQIVGEDQPPSLQISPERWIQEFIPGVEIGYYDLPQFPRQATTLDLTFALEARTVGGAVVPITVQFPEITIAESWKLREGQSWDAQERTATDEELQAAGHTPKPAP